MPKLFRRIFHKPKLDFRTAVAVALLPGVMLMVVQEVFLLSRLYEWYFPQMDILMHILGGATVAWAAFALMHYGIVAKRLSKPPFYFALLAAVGAAAVVGILWELYEYFHDFFKHAVEYQLGTDDTMKDLANDLLGGLLASLLLGKRLLKK